MMDPQEMAMQQALSSEGPGGEGMEMEGGGGGPMGPDELMSLAQEFSGSDPELAQLIAGLAQERQSGGSGPVQ